MIQKPEIASPLVPVLLKYSLVEAEDQYSENIRCTAESLVSVMSHFGKTVGSHADTLIDAKLENEQTDGLLGQFHHFNRNIL